MTNMKTETSFKCSQCGETKSVPSDSCTTGYGLNKRNQKICYACCGKNDEREMRETGKAVLYLTTEANQDCKLTNWPGTLSITGRYRKGNHNIAGSRYDVWFRFACSTWHGVQYGENTQICRCKKIKG